MTPRQPAQCGPARLRGQPLSTREVQVLTLAAQGRSNEGIAHDLGIALQTVKTYLVKAYAKLGAVDRANAVHLAHDLITAKESTR